LWCREADTKAEDVVKPKGITLGGIFFGISLGGGADGGEF